MERTKPTSIKDHQQVVETLRKEAEALGAGEFGEPDVPIKVFIDELRTTLLATEQHFSSLAAVGYTEAMAAILEWRAAALESVQTLWSAERRGGRSEAVASLIEGAEEVRGDLLSASDLALRHSDAGRHRVSAIREGEGLADLVFDLNDLAALLTDFRAEFEAIKLDVDAEAERAARARDDLKRALAEEDVAKTLTGYKELRDRIFALTKRSLDETRAFAAFAFRKDKTSQRRHLFTSAYNRRRNRRNRGKGTAEPAISAVTP
jgi:hypothetical protein